MEHSAIPSHATMVRAFVGPLFERFVVVEKAKVYAACPKFPRIIETVDFDWISLTIWFTRRPKSDLLATATILCSYLKE